MNQQQLDYSVNLLKAIVWQYDSAANLRALVEAYQEWRNTNQTEFWENWYTDVFDLRTANAFGLKVWSIILNVPIVGPASEGKDGPAWAFGSARQNFNRGNFGGSGAPITLQEDQARLVLRLRYYQLISRGTIPETNAFLKELFADQGPVYVQDNLDMTMTFVFGFELDSAVRYVLDRLDILPRPSGVLANYERIPVCTPPEFGDYATEYLENLVDASITYNASMSDCTPYIVHIDNFQATAGYLSVVLSSSVGDYLYKVFINSVMVEYGTGVDGTIWDFNSAGYSDAVDIEVILYCALESDTASATVGFSYSATPAGDDYWDDVLSLLYFQGTEGGTSFPDEKGLTWNGSGSAITTTSEFIYGDSSLQLDGINGHVYHTPSDHSVWDFGSDDLTIEAWVNPALINSCAVISKRSHGMTGWALDITPTGLLRFRSKVGGVWTDTDITSDTGVVPSGEWTHVAICRSGDDWLVFIGGVLENTVTKAGALDNETANVNIGLSAYVPGENFFEGFIGPVRVTKGVCRYTVDFTPETYFPNFGD